jgi:hypothetical protein
MHNVLHSPVRMHFLSRLHGHTFCWEICRHGGTIGQATKVRKGSVEVSDVDDGHNGAQRVKDADLAFAAAFRPALSLELPSALDTAIPPSIAPAGKAKSRHKVKASTCG